ncbi:TonB-dependent receptor [Pseudomonas sediminis]|uniref:TonB-dependent receptor domain-containing protein n=1 Tax=Pseudomonas sediminis TaxID=1691904 RepID=UPI0024497ACA|nr:TonB-dependent receptor [Pseudomonas sediminis]MDG9760462.1 TonB-dependent receptor [Pseudomonas sediminis]
MKLSRLALAIAVMPGLSLAAEPYVAEPLVVTSGRLAEPQARATAATTVFERDDIERLQVSSVTELLERVPGLSVVRTGGAGSQTGVFLRGTSTAQTLVLVDGQRIAAASSGTSSLEFLAPEQIERIEVVRGARSALYGSDAIGGVIQIFTRQGDDQGLKPYARLAAGSDSTYQRSLGLSGGDERTRFHLGAALDETAGIDATRDGFGANADDDAYRNRSLSLNLSHRFDETLHVGLNALDQRGQVEYDFTGMQPTTDFQLSSLSGFIDGRLNEHWSSRLELGHSKDQRASGDDSPLASADSFFTYTTYRDSISWVNTLTLNDNQQVLVGTDWYEDRLHSSTPFSEDSRWNRAAFVQHRYTGDTFSTEMGLRHDDNQQFGSENTWNAALTLPLNSANDLILSYSEGFRAPTFNDLYDPWAGNPDLQAERSKSYEIQWRSRYSDTGSLQTSVYRTDIEDAIVANEVSFYVPQNVQHARINGFEAAVEQELFGWQGNLALALIDPRDRDSGHTLQRRAKRTLSLDLDRRFGDVSVGAGWRAISGRYDDADNDIEMSGYGLLSLRAAWQANEELGLSLKLDNLLDKDYAEATYSTPNGRFGYNSAGRTALFAVTWTPQL